MLRVMWAQLEVNEVTQLFWPEHEVDVAAKPF